MVYASTIMYSAPNFNAWQIMLTKQTANSCSQAVDYMRLFTRWNSWLCPFVIVSIKRETALQTEIEHVL